MKSEFGWELIKTRCFFSSQEEFDIECVKKCMDCLNIQMDEVKTIFMTANDTVITVLPNLKELILKALTGTMIEFYDHNSLLEATYEAFIVYSTKIFAGESYFNDYSCFVPKVIHDNYEFHVGDEVFTIPFQFKTFPCFFEETYKIKARPMRIKLITDKKNFHYSPDCDMDSEEEKIFDIIYKGTSKEITLNVHFDITGEFFYKLEDSEARILKRSDDWNDAGISFPKLSFMNGVCNGIYYKNGLEWNLKDVNGLAKIPTAIDFDSEIPLIGKAAIEDGKFGQSYDFELLLNLEKHEKRTKKLDWKNITPKEGREMAKLEDHKRFQKLFRTDNIFDWYLEKLNEVHFVIVFISMIIWSILCAVTFHFCGIEFLNSTMNCLWLSVITKLLDQAIVLLSPERKKQWYRALTADYSKIPLIGKAAIEDGKSGQSYDFELLLNLGKT
uniref:Uncharacterized protein n=1 Tax=Panagrolaimus sp. JU765 TaxID=591449 RepID=A0AC34RRZ5_9BILA